VAKMRLYPSYPHSNALPWQSQYIHGEVLS
jgi:hypothetical protein